MAGGRGRGRNGGMPPGTTQDDANDLGDEDEDEDEDNDTRRHERLKRTNKQVPNYQQTTVAHEQ